MNPTGKSVMAWILSLCCGGDMFAWAERLRAMGCTSVFIRAADGTLDDNVALLPRACEALRAVGIEVWGWQALYGNSVAFAALEADAAARNIDRYHLSGWAMDAESAYKRTGAAAWADSYTHRLRSTHPTIPLGLCSYRFPSLHPELPWPNFLSHCNYHMPQVYWIGATNPDVQLRRSYRELTALAILPVYPVGCAFYENSWRPTVLQLNKFDQAAHELNLPGVSWWCWDDHGIGTYPEYEAAITAHDWGTLPPPPPPPPPVVREYPDLDSFVEFYRDRIVDVDGVYPSQCMDLVHAFKWWVDGFHIKSLLSRPSAQEVWTNWNPEWSQFYERIDNGPDNFPLPGDLVYWIFDPYGHTAVALSGCGPMVLRTFDANWPIGSLPHVQMHDYRYVAGWLRRKV